MTALMTALMTAMTAAVLSVSISSTSACSRSGASDIGDAMPAAAGPDSGAQARDAASSPGDGSLPQADSGTGTSAGADVTSVSFSGSAGSYNASVTLASPDTGCERYADWWEVVTPTGELLYRRILTHSHVNEQPFTRSGGPVDVDADQEIIVRAHMHPSGYGGQAMRGSVNAGFVVDGDIDAAFAPGLASAEPLPTGCAF